jgi:hypothetical protein
VEDREFFDTLFQLFTQTTGAEDTYWSYAETEDEPGYTVYSVGESSEHIIGYVESEADAEFITAIHGCLPDLVRRLHMALDESDRADYDRDSRECRIYELEIELSELKSDLEGLING